MNNKAIHDTIKLCINCKNFIPNYKYTNINQQYNNGFCKIATYIPAYSNDIHFFYAITNRLYGGICGPNGKEFKYKL